MEESLTLLLATDELLAIEDYLDKADITTFHHYESHISASY